MYQFIDSQFKRLTVGIQKTYCGVDSTVNMEENVLCNNYTTLLISAIVFRENDCPEKGDSDE